MRASSRSKCPFAMTRTHSPGLSVSPSARAVHPDPESTPPGCGSTSGGCNDHPLNRFSPLWEVRTLCRVVVNARPDPRHVPIVFTLARHTDDSLLFLTGGGFGPPRYVL